MDFISNSRCSLHHCDRILSEKGNKDQSEDFGSVLNFFMLQDAEGLFFQDLNDQLHLTSQIPGKRANANSRACVLSAIAKNFYHKI